MLSNLEIVAMATEDGPCLDAILGAKGRDRGLLLRFEALLFRRTSPLDCPPSASMFPDAVDSRESSVRGPLTGHFTGRVLRGMFA